MNRALTRLLARKSRLLTSNQRGQASLMIGMMMLTFILFFLFVINTGMLVNAKINLQNAADLAAYAGAATQARQLNTISYLNYEMRRQYKKFLFRYYVMGNMAQGSHPAGPQRTPRQWRPRGTQNTANNPDFKVPSVCVMFKPGDNYCQLEKLPSISIPPASFGDAITETLRRQLTAIENIRKSNCDKIAEANLKLLMLWLFNSDPEVKALRDPNINLNADGVAIYERIRGLSLGLGLLPREFLLLQRIKTLESYVNARPLTGLTVESASQLSASQTNYLSERAIQAFFSAYYTLGNNSFDASSIRMDELLPGDTDRAQLLKLDRVTTGFDTYALIYEDDTAGSGGTSVSAGCSAKLAPVTIPEVPVGVAKDPSVLTYYAVRLKAKARILFSPFGDVELKAYAAAQPFGSRIGPPKAIAERGFTRTGEADQRYLPGDGTAQARANGNLVHEIPALPVFAGDSSKPAAGSGWENNFVIFSMFQKFAPESNPTQMLPSIGPQDLERAYQAAMVPNPPEAVNYNILTDLGDDPMVRNFDTSQNASFWAPLFSDPAAGRGEIQQAMEQAFSGQRLALGSKAENPRLQQELATLRRVMVDGISQYINTLSQGGGEDGEGMNVVRLRDPFTTRSAGGETGGQRITLPPEIMISTATETKTSWNQVNDGAYRDAGRVGYSVKYVSFDSLTKNKLPANGSDTWGNDLPLDGETQGDVEMIKH